MFISIDYGEKRIGIAISDETGLIAKAFPYIDYKGDPNTILKIKELCGMYQVEKIIVGIPLSNSASPQAKRIERFIVTLKQELNIPVETWDESFTSQDAYSMLNTKGQSNKREKIDSESARIILQEFLDFNNTK